MVADNDIKFSNRPLHGETKFMRIRIDFYDENGDFFEGEYPKSYIERNKPFYSHTLNWRVDTGFMAPILYFLKHLGEVGLYDCIAYSLGRLYKYQFMRRLKKCGLTRKPDYGFTLKAMEYCKEKFPDCSWRRPSIY